MTNKRSIQVSLLLFFFFFQLFIYISLAVVLRIAANDRIYNIEKNNLSVIADSLEDTITTQMEAISELVFAHSLNPVINSGFKKGDFFDTDIVLNRIMDQSTFFEAAFLADNQGIIKAASRFNILRSDISDREYYRAIIFQNMEKYVTRTAIESIVTGNPVIVIATPIRDKGQIIGLLGVSVDLELFGKEMISNKEIGEEGYAFVVDNDDKIIIHPDPELKLQNVSEWDFIRYVRLQSGARVFHPYTFSSVSKLGAFVKIPAYDWLIGVNLPEKEVLAVGMRLTRLIILILFAGNIIMTIFQYFLIRAKIVRRLAPLELLMYQAARGQLNERGRMRGQDELASLTGSYNTLIDTLGSFFEGLHQRLSQLENGGKDLFAHMEETGAAVSQIQNSINSSMGQFRQQEESIDSTLAVLEQMTRNIESQDKSIIRQNESIQGSSSAVEQLIAQIRTLSSSTDEAENSMKVLHESSLTGQRNLQHVAELVMTISEKSRELENANSLISGIAARTNLLAMNAAIEAAHAGQSGRGFAVVADEIRKLAEQAAGQSKQVKDSISEINRFIREVVEGSRISGQSYEDILENIDRVGLLTSEIRSSMEEQSSGGAQVLESLKEMRDFALGVQEGSGEMARGNKVILSEVSSLRDVNRLLNQVMKEITLGIDEINLSVQMVSDLAGQNRDSIEGVREDASRYKL